MTFALHQNWKDIKYRKQVGQSPEENWRSVRDQHYVGMFDSWKTQLMTWKNLTHYNIPLYLPYEKLMDPREGNKLLIKLAALFRSQGAPTVSDADMSCLWYQSLGKEQLDRYHKYRYDFEEYTPGFTQPQIDYIAGRLQEFAEQVRDDPELAAILKMYHSSVLRDTKIDRNAADQPS